MIIGAWQFRQIWNLPFNTHGDILYRLSGDIPRPLFMMRFVGDRCGLLKLVCSMILV